MKLLSPEAGVVGAAEVNAEAPMTPAYALAIDAHDEAMRKFRRAAEDFAAERISQIDFMRAREERDAAHDAFEAAYNLAISQTN